LVRAMTYLHGVEGIGIVEFDPRDIVRHRLVKEIVDAFDRHAKKEEKETKK
ncbi:MAG: PhoH family protein, partial [Alistipes sp.]|nr:PhoH family protein [Alistipes sp.]